jgi:hypothetical protein
MSPHSSYSSQRCEARAYVPPETPSPKRTIRAGWTAGEDYGLTCSPTECFRHLVQEPVSLHDRIRYSIPGYVKSPSDNMRRICISQQELAH